MRIRLRFTIILACLAVCGVTSFLSAQQNRPVRQRQEMLLLEVDNAATRKFTTAQTHLRVGQVREAVELLQSIGDAHAGKLVAAGNGRYVNVQSYAQMLCAGLSTDGLRIYREKLDAALKPSFEAARSSADEAQLQKILLQGYCCSFSDDALLALGDLAWDAGDLWRARSYWEQLLPPPPPKQPGEPVAWLAYPDSDLDQPSIVGRLILTTIQSGQREKVRKELAEFARRYPEASGRLAGKSGNLLEILQGIAKEAESWREPVQTSLIETFGGNSQRFHLEQKAVELGSVRWRARLKAYGEEPRRGFQLAFQGGPCYFPVVYGDIVFVNDDEQIQAYNLRTGAPAWSDNPTDAQIYACNVDRPEATIPPRGQGDPIVGNIGWPRFTMTISEGRLFARMGPVRPYSGDRGGLLTCLDLAHGEGKLVWERYASTVEPEVGGWIFEGSPVVEQGRVYVGLRRSYPQPQSNVACFDALTGKLIWNRKICVGQMNPNFQDFDVNQHLLTWGEGTLYYTTHMGAIAALEPQQGTIKWVVSYPRVEDARTRHELAARLQRGPLPAMFADGVLYAAPIDSDELLALDAETGLVKWKRPFGSPVHSLLGVSKGLVFASGAKLSAVSVDTGDLVWEVGDADPESYGFGRGLLVEDLIYWPTHEEVFVLDQETGIIRRRLHLFAAHGQYGGNLLMTDGHLLVAQPNGLAAFSDRGPPPNPSQPPKPLLTRDRLPLPEVWRLARENHATGNWTEAVDYLERTKELAHEDDEWMGRPLLDVATAYFVDCGLRQAAQASQGAARSGADENAQLKSVLQLAMLKGGRDRIDGGLWDAQHPATDHAWRLRFPASASEEAREWLREHIAAQVRSLDSTHVTGYRPPIREVRESFAPLNRSVAWRDLATAKLQPVSAELKDAERKIDEDPDEAVTLLHNLIPRLETPEERVVAWSGVAKALERQQAWGAALDAWKQMAHVAPSETLVSDADRQLRPDELIRERLLLPHYVKQKALSAKCERPSVLVRHWQATFEAPSHAVYPAGLAPSVDLACVLVDRSPATCLNLADGKIRWQTPLSHALRWAGYVADRLLLATEVEVRAVSLLDGTTLWYQRLCPDAAGQGASSRQLITFESGGTRHAPKSRGVRTRSEFALSDGTLLVRLNDDVIQMRNAFDGELKWQFETRRQLAPGWALTDRHILICQQSPPALVVLDRQSGTEVARRASDSAPWTRLPFVRDDGSVLTVGTLGKIESWSKPGSAWQEDAGPRGWGWDGSPSQAIVPPDVLGKGSVSLLVLDGTTLVAVDSELGNVLWKTGLGTAPLADVRSAICCDDDQVYVAADGILRAYGLQSGELNWERYLGSASLAWKARVHGAAVFAYPAKSAGKRVDGRATICETASGRYVQRLSLPSSGGDVELFPTGHTTLLACGNALCGLGQ